MGDIESYSTGRYEIPLQHTDYEFWMWLINHHELRHGRKTTADVQLLRLQYAKRPSRGRTKQWTGAARSGGFEMDNLSSPPGYDMHSPKHEKQRVSNDGKPDYESPQESGAW